MSQSRRPDGWSTEPGGRIRGRQPGAFADCSISLSPETPAPWNNFGVHSNTNHHRSPPFAPAWQKEAEEDNLFNICCALPLFSWNSCNFPEETKTLADCWICVLSSLRSPAETFTCNYQLGQIASCNNPPPPSPPPQAPTFFLLLKHNLCCGLVSTEMFQLFSQS